MKDQFFTLAERLCEELHADEVLLCSLSAEVSDFVRFNHSRVRQAGRVEQRYVSLRLIRAQRQAYATLALAGAAEDLALCRHTMRTLREQLAQLPEDPWLLYATHPQSTSSERRGLLPPSQDVVHEVATRAADVDFVGFYAAGTMYRAFANSLGQRNWHEVETYNFDWSLHLEGDKAVKGGYAGTHWDANVFAAKLEESARDLARMTSAARTLAPGEYRVYLAPRAMDEVAGLLSWDAFSARARATHQSALIRMDDGEKLSAKVSLIENTQAGYSPAFQGDGYVRPGAVVLVEKGAAAASLVSARSAREYGLALNGSNGRESPESLHMLPGDLEDRDVLTALDTGLYVSNLWYLNFSDKPAARMTGMTRFATFWVEGGRIVAPVNPLRFDDTIYRMLGSKLERLTRERELLLSTSTYDERSTASSYLPGALLESLRFTL
jgi:predicted Zn-dependent protease